MEVSEDGPGPGTYNLPGAIHVGPARTTAAFQKALKRADKFVREREKKPDPGRKMFLEAGGRWRKEHSFSGAKGSSSPDHPVTRDEERSSCQVLMKVEVEDNHVPPIEAIRMITFLPLRKMITFPTSLSGELLEYLTC